MAVSNRNFPFAPSLSNMKETVESCFIMMVISRLPGLKNVPVCEENPIQSIKSNVAGTRNIIDTAIENSVNRVIYVSPDKEDAEISRTHLMLAL